jgi:hypothetical protein
MLTANFLAVLMGGGVLFLHETKNDYADWLTGKLLLGLGNTVILNSEPHGTHGHILLSDRPGSLQNTDCPGEGNLPDSQIDLNCELHC